MDHRLADILTNMKSPTILVVGDVILDRYVSGNIDRVSPESPAQVLEVTDESETLGGAANVAANVCTLGGKALFVGVTGIDKTAKQLRQQFKKYNIKTDGLIEDGSRPTTTKTRFLAMRQQMLRVDRERRSDVAPEIYEQMLIKVERVIGSVDGVIVSDYGKGAMPIKFLKRLFTLCRKAKVKSLVDPKGADYTRYKGAHLITPNKKEASYASGVKIETEADIKKAAKKIFADSKIEKLVITRGEEGMTVFNTLADSSNFPAKALEVFDVSGAGDTVIAAIGLAYFSGLTLDDSVRIANVAAGIEVGHVGAWAVSKGEVLGGLNKKAPGEEKIMTGHEVASFSAGLRAKHKKVVFTNGCFDLLHAGHVKLLQKARSLGDALIVGLNSDSSITRLKGKDRPLLGEEDRLHILAALDCVDAVTIFGEDTPLRLIRGVMPDILVKGGDYDQGSVVGADEVAKNGGVVRIVPLVDGKSTTGIIEKILKKNN